jgi:mannose-6-phosphate isomerase-like protein (cupin superfamily)
MDFETKQITERPNNLAPDGSEIRLLPRLQRGGMAHCTLGVGQTSQAVAHHSVEEIWYFLEGEGQVWRKQGERELVVDVRAEISLTIPTGTHFQFRNTGSVPLRFVVATMPPWPGQDEAYEVENYWSLDK